MKEELKELIQKHLPSMAAGELKNYLEQYEKDKAELQSVKQQLDRLTTVKINMERELKEFRDKWDVVLRKEADLAVKEENLKEREFNFKVSELTYKLAAEKQSKDSIFKLVETFVANPRAIEVTTRNRTYQNFADYDNNGRPQHYPVSSFE